MWCAECGQAMEQRLDGAWHICCNAYGYWYDHGPLQRDSWWPVLKVREYYFYPTVKWPKNQKPKVPKRL